MPRSYRDPHYLVIEALQRREPGTQLRAVGELRMWLDELEPKLVMAARSKGWSWEQVAEALSRSKQAVWERYRRIDTAEVASE